MIPGWSLIQYVDQSVLFGKVDENIFNGLGGVIIWIFDEG